MPRYIDADALKHELCIRQHMLDADSLWKTLEIMDAQPTADVVERKKGRWLNKGRKICCSECGRVNFCKPNFCDECGAEMI